MALTRGNSDDAGPSAFDIELSVSTGRHSPVGKTQTVKVNVGSTVRMVFMNGGYILRSVHGRNTETLQKDFDLYLLRPGRDDIVLNPLREIADYGIQRKYPVEQLQFRHKTLPISLVINLSEGDDRKIEVSSGFPVMDTIPSVCDKFGIREYEELSLARPTTNTERECIMQYEWLDVSSSLNGQGVHDGDTLYLRKKFFILNDDIQEALTENRELLELIYQQVRFLYLTDRFIGGYIDDTSCALVSSLLHHIDQGSESISDHQVTSNVMPRNRQENTSFYANVVATYFRDQIGELEITEAKDMFLRAISEAENILLSYYPVRVSKKSDVEDHILAIDKDRVSLCCVTETDRLEIVANKTWRIRDLRDTDIPSEKEDLLKVNVLGFWQPFYTKYHEPLACYLMEASILMKKKVAMSRLSQKVTSPEAPKQDSQLVQEELCKNQPKLSDKLESKYFEWPVRETAAGGEMALPEATPEPDDVITETPDNPMNENGPATPPIPATPPNTASIDMVGDIEFHVPEVASPSLSPKDSPKRDLGWTNVHIPDFLELDYRQILANYRLFHIVVMKQDMRPILLHTGKPIGEVLKDICGTFGISNSSQHYLWIPTGIQSIVEKYGGKPKLRAGKFQKKRLSGALDFNPRLDNAKKLKDQYDLSIMPYLLHLKKYQGEDETDASDESVLDYGEEWPDSEHPDVARYRQFYQSWTGLVQGSYPINKRVATKLAALLIQVYYGDRQRARVWPPPDYEPKTFLPEKYQNQFGIVYDIEKQYKELSGTSTHECINDVIEGCRKMITHQGVFFDVSVPVRSDIMAVIPWNKMEHRWFGINKHGIFSVDKNSGKIMFTHRFSDIYKWSCTENSFKLNFKEWAEDFHAYTYQAKEILDTLELFIQLTLKEQTHPASSRPSSFIAMSDPEASPFSGRTSSPITAVRGSTSSPITTSNLPQPFNIDPITS